MVSPTILSVSGVGGETTLVVVTSCVEVFELFYPYKVSSGAWKGPSYTIG